MKPGDLVRSTWQPSHPRAPIVKDEVGVILSRGAGENRYRIQFSNFQWVLCEHVLEIVNKEEKNEIG